MVSIFIGIAIYTQSHVRIVFLHLSRFGGGHFFNGRIPRIFCQCQRNIIQGIGKGTNGVLVDTSDGIGIFVHGQGARNFSRSSSVHNPVVTNEIAYDAHGIVQRSFGFFDNHAISPAYQNCHGRGICGMFQDNHAFALGGSQGQFVHAPGLSQFIGRQIFKACHDASTGGHGNVFNFDSAHPSHGGEIILQKQVIGFVIKAPLANDQIGATILDPFDHVTEILLFLVVQGLVGFGAGDVQLVFGFGFGRLKGTSQDAEFGILNVFGHLRVGHFLVNDNTVHQIRVFQTATGFALHTNVIEIDISAFPVHYLENGLDGNFGHLSLVTGQNLTAQGGHGGGNERFLFFRSIRGRGGNVNGFGNFIQSFTGNGSRLFQPLGNSNGMNALLHERFGLFQECARQHHHTGGPIANFIIL
mmetsp:Transcript_30546/g.63787  ORF Transcript_30546/g.63787 Transcript_30546/m.63787 type:complete len:414 (-) Transcript_30546:55-1296(-)